MSGTWKNEGRTGWTYTGHGWGVYGVQRTRNGWYAFHRPFAGDPVGIGMYGSRQEAQKHVENTVAKLVATKARKGNPVGRKTFSTSQLNALRREFADIETVNPDRLADFHRIFDGLSDAGLKQLANARVKFMSGLARNALTRRGLKRNPMRKKRSAAQKAATAKMIAANRARKKQLRSFAKVVGHSDLSRLAAEGARKLRAYRKSRGSNPRKRKAKQVTMPAHRYRGFGVIRAQPGTVAHIQYLVTPYTTWGREHDAMSFGLQSAAKYAAQKCGHVCAVVPLGPGHNEAVQEFIAYRQGKG